MADDTERWFTCEQAAELCGVSLTTMKRWVRDKQLDSVRIGRTRRITQAALNDLAYRNRVRAQANERRLGRRPGKAPAA